MKQLAVLLAPLALAALVATPAPAGAQPLDDLPVRIAVESLSPVLRPGDGEVLHVAGRITNTGTESLRGLRARLLLGEPVGSRSLLNETPGSNLGGTPVGDERLAGELSPDSVDSLAFTFDVPVEELSLDRREPHVHRLRVDIRSRGVRVGVADTFLPWWPAETQRTRISWVWPLVEPSHRALGSDFYDADLLGDLVDGRLATLLDTAVEAAPGTPVTWAVDPELIESVSLLAKGSTIRSEPEGRSPGQPEAMAWLTKAKRALGAGALLTLPYGDPDLAALADTVLASDIAGAVRFGDERMRELVGRAGDPELAWPPDGQLDVRTQELLTGVGAQGIVVAERALPLQESLTFTPTAPYPLQAGALTVTALVADSGLADLVAAGPGDTGRRIAVQRFLAETALITLERPNDARSVVVTPPRTWDPDPAYAGQLLAFTGSVPWLAPTTLPQTLREPVSTAPRTLRPAPVGDALRPEYVQSVLAARRMHGRYRSILTTPGDLPRLLDDALLRAESAGWRDQPAGGARLVGTVSGTLREEFAKLQVATGGVITLSGSSGKIPITVVNDLGQPVLIRIRLNTRGRLALDENCYRGCEAVTVNPGRATVTFTGEPLTSGNFPVYVELLPPSLADDAPLVPVATLQIRSKNFGKLALLITGGAFALLLGGSVQRLLRRHRRAATAEAA